MGSSYPAARTQPEHSTLQFLQHTQGADLVVNVVVCLDWLGPSKLLKLYQNKEISFKE